MSALSGPGWYQAGADPRVLLVIGGSSPFTLAMVEEVVRQPPWPDGVLRLQGRDQTALSAVSACASSLLRGSGWQVEATTGLEEALDGADVAIHQNRYGGLAWRTQDEILATSVGIAPDETQGPGGLAAAMRTVHGQRPYAAALAARAPGLPVLTMTNPLGVSTAAFAVQGVPVLGVCELPEMTRLEVASALDIPVAQLAGSYCGLNHRGFWHHLRTPDGGDLLPTLVKRLEAGESALPGIDADEIRRLHAVPDKYHALLLGRQFLAPGRAAALDRLRSQILSEAAADPDRLPPSLAGRDMPWHRLIVMPVLRAIAGEPVTAVVTRAGTDGVAVEQLVRLRSSSSEPVASPEPPELVAALQRRFRAHEAAVMAAASDPTYESVHAALALDPIVPAARVDDAAAATLEFFRRWLAASHD